MRVIEKREGGGGEGVIRVGVVGGTHILLLLGILLWRCSPRSSVSGIVFES
jgi:hypothetical protein